LWLDLDELEKMPDLGFWFSTKKRAALRFLSSDYLNPEQPLNKDNVWAMVSSLGGEDFGGKVCLLAQVRCFGLYFSPVNFFYCYDAEGNLRYLLAEVSNTPWNERHCYLVPTDRNARVDKVFHVSPFMHLDMHYRWRFPNPSDTLLLHIENHRDDKLFDATLVMRKHPMTRTSLRAAVMQIPVMCAHIFIGIYWQALRLWLKRVPYIPYLKKEKPHAGTN
ncbi:MAG: DUF1365 domain-containing protein, partial [Granulosicoccaceae bacterium]